MKNKIMAGIFAATAIAFPARLSMTERQTDRQYRGEVVMYARRNQGAYPVFNMMFDSLSGMSRPGYWNSIGVDIGDVKVFRGGSFSSEKKFYDPGSHHALAMFTAFDVGMGGNYVRDHLDSVVLMSRMPPSLIPRGIASMSSHMPAGSTGFMTSGSVFFGDTVNELAGGYHQSPRLLGLTSDNTNLFIGSFGNDDTLKPGAKVKGDDINAAAASQESFYLPMFGEEVQKLSRADTIKVKDFVCSREASAIRYLPDIRGIDGPRQDSGFTRCAVNDADTSDRYPVYALYARTHTLVADGEIYAAGERRQGSSYAIPRLSALATRVLQKFPGMSYQQVKQVLLTTARREKDELDSYTGWGIADASKALRGPSALNAGLIEEQKFFTGMYDRTFDFRGNAYFWAEPASDWTWSNDIYGNFARHPEGAITLNLATNAMDGDGDFPQARLAFQTVREVGFRRYIPSERNYYGDTADFRPGLRKAGPKTLTINGSLYYTGPTEVLGGNLVLNGKAVNTTIVVYEGANLVVNGEASRIVLAGGRVQVMDGARIGILEADPDSTSRLFVQDGARYSVGTLASTPEKIGSMKRLLSGSLTPPQETSYRYGKIGDVTVNPKKFADARREYFLSGFRASWDTFAGNSGTLEQLRRRYPSLAKAPKELLETVPGYSDGKFRLDGYGMAHWKEFAELTNPFYSNESFRTREGEWTTFQGARRQAGMQ